MKNAKKFRLVFISLIFLEITLLFLLFSFFSTSVNGGISNNTNATVITQLTVGNVGPEILNLSIDGGTAPITLIANSTKLTSCVGLVRDWNNETDIVNVTGRFFDTSYGASQDNNHNYRNDSCLINRTFGTWKGVQDTNYTALVNCSFLIYYYADPITWNCTLVVNDTLDWSVNGTMNTTIGELLAVELPNIINYGTVNSTYVSNENITNVTNVGNVQINLSLSGYAQYIGDGNAMNCSLGSSPNISIQNEKYNLTGSNSADTSLSQVETHYTNLTTNVTIKKFDLAYRTDDTVNEATNMTYWRMYVPVGVGGTCSGNIIFGATKAAGTAG